MTVHRESSLISHGGLRRKQYIKQELMVTGDTVTQCLFEQFWFFRNR